MTRARSNTPPTSSRSHKKGQHRVEFSPTNSTRRGSGGSGGHPKLQSKESADREKHKRLEMVARARDRREAMLKRVRSEKKFMLFSSLLAFLALFLWFVAVFTDHWVYVQQTEDMIEKAFNKTQSGDVFASSNSGLWRTCQKFQTRSAQNKEICSYFKLFLKDENIRIPQTLNEHVIDYTRTQICFAFISVLLMTMTIVAAFYTFKNSRYVYKRLASCLYFMTTLSVLIVLQVLVTSVNYAEGAKLYEEGAVITYGFSLYMGWSVFLVYLVNGCIFLVLSRKRKYDDGSDGGQFMGR